MNIGGIFQARILEWLVISSPAIFPTQELNLKLLLHLLLWQQILYCWVTREVYTEVHKMQIVLSFNYIPIFNPLVSFLKFLEIGIIDNYLQCIYIEIFQKHTFNSNLSLSTVPFPLCLPLPPFLLLLGLSWPYSQVKGTFSENGKIFFELYYLWSFILGTH